MIFSSIKKIFLALVFTSAAVLCWSESKDAKYDELMKEGSAADIVQAFAKDNTMAQARIGTDKDNLLLLALKYNRPEQIINLLLKGGVNPSYRNKNRQTALMYACRYSNDINVIKLIIRKSGNSKKTGKLLQEKDKNGKSSYDYAAENEDPIAAGYIDRFKGGNVPDDLDSENKSNPVIMLEKDPEPEPEPEPAQEVQEATAEEPAAPAEEIAETAAETIPAGPAPEEEKKEPVAEEPAVEVTPEVPVQSSPAVNKYDKTYLYDYMTFEEDPEPEEEPDTEQLATIKNPDKKDKNGRTQLMSAVKDGNDWEIKSLIHSGADVNLRDKDGWTALMYAARYQNNVEILNMLLNSGADASARNNFGTTALQLASSYSGNPDILKKLIAVSMPDSEELYKSFILTITSSSSNALTQITKIRIFIERGIAINRFYEGKTPLMYAAEYASSTDIIKILLDNGAVPGVRTSDGKTAFNFAESNSHLEHNDIYWSLNGK